MKKFIVLILICILSLFLFSACDNVFGEVLNNMSDMRINYFEGNNQNIYVNFSCGHREDVFAYDGKSQNPIECGVLVLGFYELQSYSSISVLLEVDGIEAEYTLQKSPYDNTFMEDIGKILTGKNKIFLRLKNQTQKIELTEVSNSWKIDYKKAIKIGVSFFKSELTDLYFNGRFNAECYLKIVSKPDFDKKYWYFSYIDKTNVSKACLIDVFTGDVLSSKS